MSFSAFKEKYLPLIKTYSLPLILGCLGLIFLSISLIGYFGQQKDKPDILFDAAATTAANSLPDDSPASVSSKNQDSLAVDVEGAVQNPGVYKLPVDSRIEDALIAAGGLGKDADRERIARIVNLAAKINDGTKIYIASIGESTTTQSSDVQTSVLSSQSNSLININSATESELDSLPGIGKTTAEKIISNRPFARVEELLEKKIVGKKVFSDIQDKIVAP